MLSTAIESYLALRRAAGFELKDPETTLREFARFANAKRETFVRTETALEWIRGKTRRPQQRYMRLGTIVRFARYVHAEDERHEIPPRDAFGHHPSRRRPPFLFTAQEVEALVCEARRPGRHGSFQSLVYSTLLGLLACTGLRISEALKLRLDDVTPEGLVVRKAKFGKSRLLPLHPTTMERLEQYVEQRCRRAGACEYLFPSIQGRQLRPMTVRGVFQRVTRSLGITSRQGRRPRIHDLRFHFTNQALMSCPGDHKGISRHMVAVTTYLGHSEMQGTYWYYEASPGLLSNIAESCEDFVGGGER